MKIKLGSIMWTSHMPMLTRACANLDFIDLIAYGSRTLEESPEKADEALKALNGCDAVLVYRSGSAFWDSLEPGIRELGKEKPVICVGHDPAFWMLSSVPAHITASINAYMSINGEENFTNMLRYIAVNVCGMDMEVEGPRPVPWEGIYHPDAEGIFASTKEYMSWYRSGAGRAAPPNNGGKRPLIGILFSRHAWVNDNLAVEDTLIRELEAMGMDVLPVFSNSVKDTERGCKGSGEVLCETMLDQDARPIIDALIKMQFFPLSGSREKGYEGRRIAAQGVEILNAFDVPVFCPFTSTYKTVDEWRDESQGLNGSLIGFSIAMPEFEGVIEPLIIGAMDNSDDGLARKDPVKERCAKVARRIGNWVRMSNKPKHERRVAFILHNNPCASVEATVGGGAQLDTLESVARILHRMKAEGYNVEPPENGKELIDTIMEQKAISEFRWTTVDEIVKKGGVLKQVTKEEYEEWFNTLSPGVRDRMNRAWGNPPGEEINGVPAAMVYEGKILVTGVTYGNAAICIQPKRGCAGPRCDGQVCKILHDPDIPPPHQYMATYRYLERDFKADVIIHVGTHGNLEFLPGKNVGLSGDCFPDIAIGDMPHLYIYNADNPAEGTIAKRRSIAVLLDHMQTVMIQGGLYEGLEELAGFLGEYEQVNDHDPGKAHVLEHMIMDAIKATGLDNDIKVSVPDPEGRVRMKKLSDLGDIPHDTISFEEIRSSAHSALSRIRNTKIQDGLHIFGQVPEGEKRIDLINSILRYDAGDDASLRKVLARMMGLELADLLEDGGRIDPGTGKSCGELLEELDIACRDIIRLMLANGRSPLEICREVLGERIKKDTHAELLLPIRDRLRDLVERIERSLEIDSLLHGFEGGYIEAGPSGLITRGRDDILPTGRNFFSLDPNRVPTKAAWVIGQRLAETLIEKHIKEEGRYPENVAIFWMAGDIMYADGEGMGQIMSLLGVRPLWQPNGRLKGFEVIPLEELKRPRIDVTVRVSGISRDNFPNCIELIDEAVQKVASLEEDADMNFVRKHALAQVAETDDKHTDQKAWRDATLRVFASKPGTYSAGTQLAVYASAWKEEKDLADVFVYWNGYAYGKGIYGEERHAQLVENLKTVDVTYNKVVTDEKDLFGCCCYFGTHGGMTAAARNISGHEVRTYYGDTREPEHVEVRDMADEVRRVVRTKLLNPKWIEGMKRHGYKGAGDISKRVGRVYGWEATTQEVDDRIFDDIARTFIMDKENREFFEENNPWALEEIGRRLLEAEGRGLWEADPDVLKELKEYYLEIEGWIEEKMDGVTGEFQGGSVDIMNADDVEDWGKMMNDVREKINAAKGK